MSQMDNPGLGKEELSKIQKIIKVLFLVFCVCTSLFHLYTAGIGVISATLQRVIHLALMMVVMFFCKGGLKRSVLRWVIDILCTLLVIAISVYYIRTWLDRTSNMTGFVIAKDIEIVMGIIMILLVLEITRRATGYTLVIVTAFFIAYALFGSGLPGFLGHKGYSLNRIITYLFLVPEGIYGMPIKISANYIVLFVTFGAILETTGGGKTFIDLGYSLTGKFRGGSGKTAVVSSALMGTISGSSVANVVTTGPFTIPLMKRTGFPPEVAGAIEAIASTGGMILPPIMGSAAFLMAENLGASYAYIAKSALIPALLYYCCVFFYDRSQRDQI
jgi:TRAP transporter 4TM/12TM fusion protein